VNSGLNLLGSRYSFSSLAEGVVSALEVRHQGQASATPGTDLVLNVVDRGYRPKRLHAPAGVPLTLTLVTKEVHSCSRAFLIPALDYGVILLATGEEKVQIPPQEPGTILPFTCSMGMYSGEIIFDL